MIEILENETWTPIPGSHKAVEDGGLLVSIEVDGMVPASAYVGRRLRVSGAEYRVVEGVRSFGDGVVTTVVVRASLMPS